MPMDWEWQSHSEAPLKRDADVKAYAIVGHEQWSLPLADILDKL